MCHAINFSALWMAMIPPTESVPEPILCVGYVGICVVWTSKTARLFKYSIVPGFSLWIGPTLGLIQGQTVSAWRCRFDLHQWIARAVRVRGMM